MKSRALFIDVSVLILNPLNGFDVEVPDELYEEYLKAFRRFDNVRIRLSKVLQPQAEAFDEKMNQWHVRNGLSVVEGGKERGR